MTVPNYPPMMMCGHAANAKDTATGAPCCVICDPPASTTIATAPPDLANRTARCSYYGHSAKGRQREGPCQTTNRDAVCLCEQPSKPNLAFFSHRPNVEHDQFYCGCWGWD